MAQEGSPWGLGRPGPWQECLTSADRVGKGPGQAQTQAGRQEGRHQDTGAALFEIPRGKQTTLMADTSSLAECTPGFLPCEAHGPATFLTPVHPSGLWPFHHVSATPPTEVHLGSFISLEMWLTVFLILCLPRLGICGLWLPSCCVPSAGRRVDA